MSDGDRSGAGAPEGAARRRLMLCDCGGSMPLDAEALAAALDAEAAPPATLLCRKEIGRLADALAAPGETIVACAQEIDAFDETVEALRESGAEIAAPRCIDIRDRAGWSEDAHRAAPKQAALLREAMLDAPSAPTKPVTSEGLCLVYGPGAVAAPAAERLSGALGVTCMITDGDAPLLGRWPAYALAAGRIAHARGAIGGFELKVDAFAEATPEGRGAIRFDAPRDGGRSRCDIIVDLSGQAPLFPAAHKRDGYLRADPKDPLAVERALYDASQLVGEFEKPLYVRFEQSLCAHSRANQTGCTRCLDVCPTSAIAPAGDHVSIDPMVCAGCGACASVCPTGAARYDDPPFEHVMSRLMALTEGYRAAGGLESVGAPRLLIHDEEHGAEMIALSARFGRGLPADVLPLGMSELGGFGHAAMLGALALGFRSVDLLLGPQSERETIAAQVALAQAMASGAAADPAERIRALDPAEPDALSDLLFADAPPPLAVKTVLPLGDARGVARLAMTAIAGDAEPEPVSLQGLEVPGGAPYGAILVDQESCTLCLACVGLCPTGALEDNPDRPELRFTEDSCIQCGICAGACPETAITLVPQFDVSKAALQPRTMHEEEPFACTECGALFGVKSTIERITEKLAGQNWMYTNSDNIRLLQMCDNCRVKAQYHSEASPMQLAERPRVRTTEDYLLEREEKQGKKEH